ncbi:Uncharacterized protein pbN1_19400 [Aromatoleum bremense]|nr:Uncharacterized protein pbN1_19400 [Aromatoleum bremense]
MDWFLPDAGRLRWLSCRGLESHHAGVRIKSLPLVTCIHPGGAS